MKLWLKVSLCAVVMVTLSTTACSLLLLLRSGQRNLNLAIDNALANQQIRAASWQSAMQTRIDESYGETAARSLAKYLMGQLGGQQYGAALRNGCYIQYNHRITRRISARYGGSTAIHNRGYRRQNNAYSGQRRHGE